MKHFTLSIFFVLVTSLALRGYPTICTNNHTDTDEFPTRLFELVDNYSCSNDATNYCEDESEKTSSLAPPLITSSFPLCPHYCEDMMHPNIGDIVYTTDCPLGAVVTLEGPVLSGIANCTGTTYTYTYVVTDNCGGEATLERVYVIGNNGPVITCPPFNLILSCGDPNNEMYINTHLGLVSAYTSCQLGLTITNDFSPLPVQNCLSLKVVVFTATDACGRTSTCSTTIIITDNTAPVMTQIPPSVCDKIECGADADYWFNHWMGYMLFGLQATDDCDDDVDFTTVPANPVLNTICDDDGKAKTIVTFVATDFCGNSSTVTGSFTIENNYPVYFSNVPPSKTISCDEDVVFGQNPNIHEICQTTLTHSDNANLSNPCTTIHVRTWLATDECGGLTRSTAQTITVVDDLPPVFSNIPADTSVSCANNVVFGTPNATDECNNFTVQVTNSTTGDNCNGSATRTWTATDACGNVSTTSQAITYNDLTPPVFTSVSPNATVTCFDDVSLGTAIATDECGNTQLAAVDSSTGDSCSGTVTRTWTATDACGNVSTTSQVITYNDNIPPTFSNVPTGDTASCPSGVSFGTPTVSDNCSAATLGFTDNTTGTSCNGTVTRTWTATDACGNSTTVSQTISFSDTAPPTITGCSNNIINLTITQAPVFPLFIVVCAKATTVTFSATDNCTAGANLSFDYTLDLFGDGTIDDSGFGKPNGFAFSYNYPINAIGNNINNIFNDHILTYTAIDECGNISTCTKSIRVKDLVPPTQFCAPFTAVLDPITQLVTVTPTQITGQIFECQLQSVLFVTSGGGTSNSLTFDCDDYLDSLLNGTSIHMVTIRFLDVWGNQSTCTNSVILELPADMSDLCGLVPPLAVVELQGQLLTEEQEAVENVSVHLGEGVTAQMTTAADGLYDFTGLPYNNNYTVTPTLDANPINGISSYDLVLMSKHILGSALLDSPYKQIAADVNKTGSITTLDIVELRKLILHIDTEFGNNTSWRFLPADFVFATPENPFASVFPEQVYINGLTENQEHDFVAIKVGDVNSSAIANTLLGGDDRNFAGKLILNVKDKSLYEGQTYQVAFTAENFEALQGYQFSLFFDKEYLTVIDLVPGKLPGISMSNFGLSLMTKGFITTSWTAVEPVNIGKEDPLFYLTFEARQNVDLSKALHISSQYTVAEAYDKESSLWDIGLRFDDSELVQEDFWLYQNIPNPFYDETLIGFELPEAAFVTFEVVDASGLELKRIERHFPKGYNSVTIGKVGLSSGLLYYRMTTSGFTETKKMVLQR
jgi:hypothetical protein